jgi:hypothetical protein
MLIVVGDGGVVVRDGVVIIGGGGTYFGYTDETNKGNSRPNNSARFHI